MPGAPILTWRFNAAPPLPLERQASEPAVTGVEAGRARQNRRVVDAAWGVKLYEAWGRPDEAVRFAAEAEAAP